MGFFLWEAQHRMYGATETLKWLQLWKLCCSSLQAPCVTCIERLEGLILRGAAADAVRVHVHVLLMYLRYARSYAFA